MQASNSLQPHTVKNNKNDVFSQMNSLVWIRSAICIFIPRLCKSCAKTDTAIYTHTYIAIGMYISMYTHVYMHDDTYIACCTLRLLTKMCDKAKFGGAPTMRLPALSGSSTVVSTEPWHNESSNGNRQYIYM